MNDTDDTGTDTTVLPATSTPGGPVLTLGEAEKAANVSRSTLRRRLHAGEIPGAVRADDGSYSIPISGLVAAGLMDGRTGPDTPPDTIHDTPIVGLADAPEVIRLQLENAELRAQKAAAEAIAEERLRTITVMGQNLDDLRRQLPPAPAAPSDTTVRRRRWGRK